MQKQFDLPFITISFLMLLLTLGLVLRYSNNKARETRDHKVVNTEQHAPRFTTEYHNH